ncbi:MAG: hypothetical protein KDD36_05095 [Flavobacteriales bacterium]|nr:hypothetical protein [Flavobacteriales bacterium]
MKRYIIPALIMAMMLCQTVLAQDSLMQTSSQLYLGMRTTVGVTQGYTGRGFGVHIGLKRSNRWNTKLFGDMIITDIADIAKRTDIHTGGVLMFYPIQPWNNIQPFILAGYGLAYSTMRHADKGGISRQRFSSTSQGGLGAEVELTNQLYAALSGQYMWHFNSELEAYVSNHVFIIERNRKAFSQHMLITLSINYCLTSNRSGHAN